ncbi:UDP-4-amino-4,6-dideoxy-N-acetyl-beta-L-altrosamine transaminase [Rhodoferax saidenbachensis]|uniref:UDP-4-amino-4, 6-dideoxy-N-acetyl-beta-L-altrosamine transaminase n=1 Tax=Rhodoferax saidenbachensis TaxID=1484693 RepID=A0A1P8KDV2_9BURK|nr:UDP-4-amino-4,6-dideoxy-N-acetyl-beta-L-altrosamine transaminase [Rhodoferax saidenbachensis]APW44184.1 UDP-4-amino-4,6-dideoxy-N-acetyl-beta-L-altrosamine transaminase [Rhodoferax saidenbachensis]
MIPYGRQDITEADIEAVVQVLRSDFLTQGPVVPAFERAVATYSGATYSVAVNSATSALHIACLALGLGPGDRLWTVPNTFVASANCGLYCGAEVDFVDIDPDSWNLSVTALKARLLQARQDGLLPKVLVPVHFGGQPPDQEAIWELAQEFGFKVIEDASHAIGASRQGERAGNCKWSDITVFSFHPVKIVTTGEGGMALTNDTELAGRMEMLRSHGITRDAEKFTQAAFGPWHYEQQALGFNYRMTDIQAALGVSQLARLDGYVERRNLLARRYDELLRGLPLQLPVVLASNRSAFHLYVVRVKSNPRGRTREQVFSELRQGGIGVNVHYMPVHLQPYYRLLGFADGAFPIAESYASEAITLPLYPQLTEEGQDQVVSALVRALT